MNVDSRTAHRRHRVGSAAEFIIETAGDEPFNDWLRSIRLEGVVTDAALDSLLREPAMYALDDVVALAERPQGLLRALGQMPPRGAQGFCEAETFKPAHTPDQGRLRVPVHRAIGFGPKVDDALMPRHLRLQDPIKLCPAICFHLSVEPASNFNLALWPELERYQFGRAGSQAVADLVAGNHQVMTIVGNPADNHVDMGVVCIPMIDSHPVELRSEVPLRLGHKVPRERLQVR